MQGRMNRPQNLLSNEWSSQLWMQFMQLHKKPEKIQDFHSILSLNPIEVLNFFLISDFLCNCRNCFPNCEDHSSFDFISTVLTKCIWSISCASITKMLYLLGYCTILLPQNNCSMHCTEKFLKVMQRVGVRIQEVQMMQNEGIFGAPDPPK